MGLLTPCLVPREGFLYTLIVPGEGFCSFQVVSQGFVPGGWFWMKLIPAVETQCKVRKERVQLRFGVQKSRVF